jgi:hypothetical protein
MPNSGAQFDKLSVELFRVFARFEYALKASGFHNGEGDATPNWQRFASSIEETLENPNTAELQEAVSYFLAIDHLTYHSQ